MLNIAPAWLIKDIKIAFISTKGTPLYAFTALYSLENLSARAFNSPDFTGTFLCSILLFKRSAIKDIIRVAMAMTAQMIFLLPNEFPKNIRPTNAIMRIEASPHSLSVTTAA